MSRLDDHNALLLFRVGPVLCCAPSLPIKTIISPPGLTHPPGTSISQPGIFKHGNHIVKVTDLRYRFGVAESEWKTGRIIIANLENEYIGFWVDDIIDVISMPADGWSNLPALIPRGIFSRTWIKDEKIHLYGELDKLAKLQQSGYLKSYIELLQRQQVKEETGTLKPLPARKTVAASTSQSSVTDVVAANDTQVQPKTSPEAISHLTESSASPSLKQTSPSPATDLTPTTMPHEPGTSSAHSSPQPSVRKTAQAAVPKQRSASEPVVAKTKIINKPPKPLVKKTTPGVKQAVVTDLHPHGVNKTSPRSSKPEQKVPKKKQPTFAQTRTSSHPSQARNNKDDSTTKIRPSVTGKTTNIEPEQGNNAWATFIVLLLLIAGSGGFAWFYLLPTPALQDKPSYSASSQTYPSQGIDNTDNRVNDLAEELPEETYDDTTSEYPFTDTTQLDTAAEQVTSEEAEAALSQGEGNLLSPQSVEDPAAESLFEPAQDDATTQVVIQEEMIPADEVIETSQAVQITTQTQPEESLLTEPVTESTQSDSVDVAASLNETVSTSTQAEEEIAPVQKTDDLSSPPQISPTQTEETTPPEPSIEAAADDLMPEQAQLAAQAAEDSLAESEEKDTSLETSNSDTVENSSGQIEEKVLAEPEPEIVAEASSQTQTAPPEPLTSQTLLEDTSPLEPETDVTQNGAVLESTPQAEPETVTTPSEEDVLTEQNQEKLLITLPPESDLSSTQIEETSPVEPINEPLQNDIAPEQTLSEEPATLPSQDEPNLSSDQTTTSELISPASEPASPATQVEETSPVEPTTETLQSDIILEQTLSEEPTTLSSQGEQEVLSAQTMTSELIPPASESASPTPQIEETSASDPQTDPVQNDAVPEQTTEERPQETPREAETSTSSSQGPVLPPSEEVLSQNTTPATLTNNGEETEAALSIANVTDTGQDPTSVESNLVEPEPTPSVSEEASPPGATSETAQVEPTVEPTPISDTSQPPAEETITTATDNTLSDKTTNKDLATPEPQPDLSQTEETVAAQVPTQPQSTDADEKEKTSLTKQEAEPSTTQQDYSADIQQDDKGITIVLHTPENEIALETTTTEEPQKDQVEAIEATPPAMPSTEKKPISKETPAASPTSSAEQKPAKAKIKTKPQPRKKEITHIVVKGDTLWDIAERYVHNPFRYPELARLSKIKNPDLIYPGDRVRIIQITDAPENHTSVKE